MAVTLPLIADVNTAPDSKLPADFNTITVADGKIAASAYGTSLASGTTQAGTPYTITLAADANAIDDFYPPNKCRIVLTGGTGSGQSRLVKGYNGATKILKIEGIWLTVPDGTTTYEIQPAEVYNPCQKR